MSPDPKYLTEDTFREIIEDVVRESMSKATEVVLEMLVNARENPDVPNTFDAAISLVSALNERRKEALRG